MPASKYLKDLSAATAKAETAIRALESESRGPDAAGNVKWIREISQTIDLLAEKVAILTRESTSANMAKEIDSYPAWKKAVKKLGAVKIRGNSDMGEAVDANGKVVGEWDGAVGILFKPGGGYRQMSKRNKRARLGRDSSPPVIHSKERNRFEKAYAEFRKFYNYKLRDAIKELTVAGQAWADPARGTGRGPYVDRVGVLCKDMQASFRQFEDTHLELFAVIPRAYAYVQKYKQWNERDGFDPPIKYPAQPKK
jgi:hypothetical protein